MRSDSFSGGVVSGVESPLSQLTNTTILRSLELSSITHPVRIRLLYTYLCSNYSVTSYDTKYIYEKVGVSRVVHKISDQHTSHFPIEITI